MIIKPKVRGFICTTAHPLGCAEHVQQQIDYVKQQPAISGPKKVLVIGASTGYGLASRITAAKLQLSVYFLKDLPPDRELLRLVGTIQRHSNKRREPKGYMQKA